MSDPHLVVAAFWSTESHDDATAHIADAVAPFVVKGSGAVVSLKGVDFTLRQWLRNIDIAEAGDWRPAP
jgi:hypothetical protein